jgi:hypothetical protein
MALRDLSDVFAVQASRGQTDDPVAVRGARLRAARRLRNVEPAPIRAGEVIRGYKLKHYSRHRARALLGLSPWSVWGWVRDRLGLSARYRPYWGDAVDEPGDRQEVPRFRRSSELTEARRIGLITRHERNMLDPVSRVDEGWGWWLFDRRPGTYALLVLVVLVAALVAALATGHV